MCSPLPPAGAPDAAAAAAATEEHNHHEAGHCNDDDDGKGIHWRRRRRVTVLKVRPYSKDKDSNVMGHNMFMRRVFGLNHNDPK